MALKSEGTPNTTSAQDEPQDASRRRALAVLGVSSLVLAGSAVVTLTDGYLNGAEADEEGSESKSGKKSGGKESGGKKGKKSGGKKGKKSGGKKGKHSKHGKHEKTVDYDPSAFISDEGLGLDLSTAHRIDCSSRRLKGFDRFVCNILGK